MSDTPSDTPTPASVYAAALAVVDETERELAVWEREGAPIAAARCRRLLAWLEPRVEVMRRKLGVQVEAGGVQ
jgi:hypothetical protein